MAPAAATNARAESAQDLEEAKAVEGEAEDEYASSFDEDAGDTDGEEGGQGAEADEGAAAHVAEANPHPGAVTVNDDARDHDIDGEAGPSRSDTGSGRGSVAGGDGRGDRGDAAAAAGANGVSVDMDALGLAEAAVRAAEAQAQAQAEALACALEGAEDGAPGSAAAASGGWAALGGVGPGGVTSVDVGSELDATAGALKRGSQGSLRPSIAGQDSGMLAPKRDGVAV